MKSAEIRELFLKYFESQSHQRVGSSRLIPDGDPTLLFTNAGMNQFKNLFLGLEKRDYQRATTSQKCVRAGGKHNDLENVGFTARHHTFFEMLGNFSFGDYFKKEAIHFAWELVTKKLGLEKDRLYVSVFEKDDEAADIWNKQMGVPKDRIFRFGEKDNFWRMGNSGPCGPCSEIFYDLDPGSKGSPHDSIVNGEDRVIEFWNLVFMQFNESEDGKQTPLPRPSVDTGMGLERLTTILQGKKSNYDNDLFQSLIQVVEKSTGLSYEEAKTLEAKNKDTKNDQAVAMRVLADHARASAFLITDGVLPSNEGRGYVLRRIMRRAIRYGRNLSIDQSLLPTVVESVITEMGKAYPELVERKNHILSVTKDEEKRFFSTLDQGTQILHNELDRLQSSGQNTLPGQLVFKLYDTFGFPADLTRLMSKEKGFEIDEIGFNRHAEEARELARASWKGKSLSTSEAHIIQWTQSVLQKHKTTPFTGYNNVVSDTAKILAISNGHKEINELRFDGTHQDPQSSTALVITDKTCFYAESGGQVGDVGKILGDSGELEVLDCTKVNDLHLHNVRITDGVLRVGDTVSLKVDPTKRKSTANNHSATHIMHAALRKILGSHVTQAGSQVGPDKLRFDFTHNKPMTPTEIESIETLVNQEIAAANNVETQLMSPKDAIAKGALALFGEKYGDTVRVLKMGDFSTELCGGTHVATTAQIRLFKIVSEGGVSSGVRRIEAITGDMAEKFVFKHLRENQLARTAAGLQENWQQFLSSESNVAQVLGRFKDERKKFEKEIQSLRGSQIDLEALVKTATAFVLGKGTAQEISGRFVFAQVEIGDRELLLQLTEKLRDKLTSGIAVLVGHADVTHPIIVGVTKNITPVLSGAKILTAVAAPMGGKGGGRPELAQGGGTDLSKISEARRAAETLVGIKSP